VLVHVMYTVQLMLCQYTICGMATHARLRHASHEVWAARPRSSWLDRWCAERRPRCPQIFKRFHAAYVDAVCNPFYSVNMVRHPSAYVWFLDFFFWVVSRGKCVLCWRCVAVRRLSRCRAFAAVRHALPDSHVLHVHAHSALTQCRWGTAADLAQL